MKNYINNKRTQSSPIWALVGVFNSRLFKISRAIATAGIVIFIVTQTSCKKLTDVPPPSTSLTGASVYASDATAIAALTGIYARISALPVTNVGFIPSLSVFSGLSADELTVYNGVNNSTVLAYYRNTLSAGSTFNNYGSEFWAATYGTYILQCNDAITGLTASTTVTPTIRNQLLGEAKFMRAFFYFYLVNLYGDVPLALTTDVRINSSLSRSPKAEVYQQIIADLRDAQHLMSPGFLDGTLLKTTTDRVRPSQFAATALLARAYLYYGNLTNDASQYVKADSAATAVITNNSFSLSTLNNAFLRSSLGNNEAIWQLQPVTSGIVSNTQDADFFVLPSTGPTSNNYAYLNNSLLNSFEPGDNRKTTWIGSITVLGSTYYYPFKYKVSKNNPNFPSSPPVTEYSMILRLGEQYLIRAEARAQQNNTLGAQADLNTIRNRAGLANTTASDKASLLTAILHERQVELFTELGQRWLDLRRTGTVDAVMGTSGACAAKGGTWSSYQQLYPVYISDIQLDPKIKQNNGY